MPERRFKAIEKTKELRLKYLEVKYFGHYARVHAIINYRSIFKREYFTIEPGLNLKK